MLDYVNERTKKLIAIFGPSDRRKIDEYLTAIREIEKRIGRVETDNHQLTPEIYKPTGIAADFAEHVRLMHDLLVVAFQADITRIATLLYSLEGSNRSYSVLGFTDRHHPITHHRYIPELLLCAKYDLQRMKRRRSFLLSRELPAIFFSNTKSPQGYRFI